MQPRRLVRALGILLPLLAFACNPGAFDDPEEDVSASDAGALDAASPAPDASDLDARAPLDARPAEMTDDGAIASNDARADAETADADAGSACFAAGPSLISYFRLDGSPLDTLPLESGGASVVAVGATFDVGHAGSSLHAGELAIRQSRLDAPSALTIAAWLRLESAPASLNAAWLWNGDETGEDLTAGYWLVVAGPSFRPENASYLAGKVGQGHLGFALTNGTEEQFLLTDEPLPLMRYVFVVASFDGSRARLYVDGKVVRDEVQHVLARSTSQPLRLASPLGGAVGPLPGQLDEVAFFSTALSQTQVSDLYQHSGLVCTD